MSNFRWPTEKLVMVFSVQRCFLSSVIYTSSSIKTDGLSIGNAPIALLASLLQIVFQFFVLASSIHNTNNMSSMTPPRFIHFANKSDGRRNVHRFTFLTI